jgi:hypothetical protein
LIDGRLARPVQGKKETRMPISYFRAKAAQCYRDARSSLQPHIDYESLLRLGHTFKAKAAAAAMRLTRARSSSVARQEAARQDTYYDLRE